MSDSATGIYGSEAHPARNRTTAPTTVGPSHAAASATVADRVSDGVVTCAWQDPVAVGVPRPIHAREVVPGQHALPARNLPVRASPHPHSLAARLADHRHV